MADNRNVLIEEQALHEQEQGLIEMEEQLHAQEQGVAQMERAFTKRNKALLNLVSYVFEQEANLLKRAEAIGPKAEHLVREMLGGSEDSTAISGAAGVGLPDERAKLVEQRHELLAARMELVEEREVLYAGRYEAIETAESAIADVERRLLKREREISEALRELIAASSSLMGDEDEDDDDEEDSDEEGAAEAAGSGSPPRASGTQHVTERGSGREPLRVVGGEIDAKDRARSEGANSKTEDQVTRRRKGRARARTNQFRITLEANLDAGEPHHFFAYRNDTPDDIPGLFIATPNLLKVGREVRVSATLAGATLAATGVVAWRRQRGETGGPPGMGIELLNLGDDERELVDIWVSEHVPVTV
ncbi:MAG: hypothetical protein CSA66_04595 [Proteobacteria bacterium]|nr:MAG: hypothetical protein CSA66_04595 [Pseudomonadota bacterium]